MQLLYPAMLWGLLALAVPIIIHFFNLQRPRQVLFSNVAFVREVKRTVVRRVQFQRWLLLLLRLLAVAAIVLAFAAPVWVSQTHRMTKGARSVVIVLDNSYSMTAGNERGAYWQQSLSLVRNIVNAYTDKDEFLVMTTNSLRLHHNFADRQTTLDELKDFGISQQVRPHSEVLAANEAIFHHASNSLREMYVIGDFQRSTVFADSQKQVTLADSNLTINYIPLGTRDQKNVYVRNHEVISQIVEKGKPLQMKMTLVNDSENDVKALGVQVRLNGKVLAIASHDLDGQSSKEIELTLTPTETGWLSGDIVLEDYPIEFDNHRYFALFVPDKEKILIVEGEQNGALRLLYKDLFPQFESSFISSRELGAAEFSRYKAVILNGVDALTSGTGDRLRTFVQQGGGLMYIPPAGAAPAGMNDFYQTTGIGMLGQALSLPGSRTAKADLDHPVFQGMFAKDRKNKTFDAPTFQKYLGFQPNNNNTHNRILTLENGAAILTETRIGQGSVFTFCTSLSSAWTDFSTKSVFAPLMLRTTQLMCRSQRVVNGQNIGSFIPATIRTSSKELIKLVLTGAPDSTGANASFIPEQYVQQGTVVLNFDKLALREGVYAVMQQDSLLEKIAFNVDDRESRLDYADQGEVEELLSDAGLTQIQVLPPKADVVANQIQEARDGVPLWKWFVILALICLLTEIVVVRFDGVLERLRKMKN